MNELFPMSSVINYGWFCVLVAIIGEMLIPFVLAPFYKGYRHTSMAISALGNSYSPVRMAFNAWMLIAGILFLFSIPAIYNLYSETSKVLSVLTVSCIALFAVGACIFSCFFSVGETKDVATIASKIHGAGSAVGFMLMLFVPLFISMLSFRIGARALGTIGAISFVLAFVCFVLFIMADKPRFQNTIIAQEGLWQRLNLLFMYLPLALVAVAEIKGRI
ncbi:MAG: DUF998 domain-containing protein [Bacteroidales bacterium]|nr:DUF998 domain-containing protein [Bacteroidales bacterium]